MLMVTIHGKGDSPDVGDSSVTGGIVNGVGAYG